MSINLYLLDPLINHGSGPGFVPGFVVDAMKVIIVGGGVLGYNLAELLVKEKHKVVVVEKNEARADYLGENLDALVLHGDGTDRKILRDGGVKKSNVLIAMTANDKTNLLVCEIAKDFKVPTIVSRIADSSNDAIFSKLGITASINTTVSSVLAFKRVLDEPGKKVINLVAGGKAEVFERSVDSKSRVLNRKVGDFSKEKYNIAAIFRNGELVKAGSKEVIQQGDTLIVVAPVEEVQNVDKLF
jgi:trk system potassium uptake protein TrkA